MSKMFFDLNIKGSNLKNNISLANYAKKYGWSHINFSYSPDDFHNALKFKQELKDEFPDNFTIDYTLEINSRNSSEVRKIINKFRDKVSCISVVGGDLKVNRDCCENIKVDVLSRPYLKRYDSGLNHVLSKEAFKNNVAIELCFRDVLNSYLSYRSKIIANFKDIYVLHRKFNFPLIISSNASSLLDIKSPRDMLAFFNSTGLSNNEFLSAMECSKNILEFNKNRENLILKGVRRINDEA